MTDNTNAKMLAMQKEHGPLLEVKDLAIDFTTDTGKPVHAVRDANFTVYPGQWVAIVGESGSGKSTSAMAVLGLLPGTGHVANGSIKLDGEEIAGAKQSEFDKLRGTKMGLVPQDPMSNLNPVWRIGTQVKEALKANNMDVAHEKRSALAKALAGDEVEVKGNDDETFLGAKELPELMTEAKKALTEAGVSGEAFDKAVARFTNEWVPGSETRWRVADDLIKAGVADDQAWYLAKKYVTGSTMDDRIAGLLSEAGLPDAATRARQFPHEFSGGMRQRALIAIGLACRPDLLIADEPTSALDVTVQKRILDHLHMLTDSLGTAVLFITHDLGLAAERAQHIVVMYKGQVVESGPSLEVLQHPQHPYTKRLVAAAPSLASQRIISAKERGENADALLDHHIAGDVGERLHRYVLSEFRVGMDVCLVAYHVRLLFIFNDLGHHRGFAGERFADEGLAFDYGYASSDGLQQLNFEMKGVARNHLALEFYAVDLHEISRVVLRIRNTA